MEKITKITKEQEEKIPEYIEKWVRVASKPLDRAKSVKVTKELFGEDKTVLIAESIDNAINIIKYIVGGKKVEFSFQLDSQLRSQLDSQLSDKVNYSYYTTQYWLSCLGYYDYAQFIGVKFDTKKLQRMEEILTAIPSIIILGNILIVIENQICRWENEMLHSDQRPAVEWQDGTGMYFLDGVKFEKELWQKVVSKEMSLSEIMKIEISDQRTVALKFNPEAIIKENAKLIHKDNRSNELYLVENAEINKITEFQKMYFLKMTCPTGRIFIEGVNPEFAEKHPNATECQAELCGLTLSDYQSMTLES